MPIVPDGITYSEEAAEVVENNEDALAIVHTGIEGTDYEGEYLQGYIIPGEPPVAHAKRLESAIDRSLGENNEIAERVPGEKPNTTKMKRVDPDDDEYISKLEKQLGRRYVIRQSK